MSKFVKIVGGLVAGVMLAVLGVGALVYTRTAEASTNAASSTVVDTALDLHGGGGVCGQAGLQAAADKLGLTVTDLTSQLWAGRTLADLADKAGVSLTDVQAAVQAACVAQTRQAIEQAVTDGTLTRDKADWLLTGLDKGYWGPGGEIGFGLRGFGGDFGFGFGGRGHGHGFGGQPSTSATPTPSTSG